MITSIRTGYETRFAHLCRRVDRTKSQINATRLWNLADHLDNPEPLWAILADECPWAFEDPSAVNSLRFAYVPGTQFVAGEELKLCVPVYQSETDGKWYKAG